MTIKRRRWLVLVVLLGISAIPFCLQGWRLLKKSQWLQQVVAQQLSANFGGVLTYERLTAGIKGVHLKQVRYAPEGQSFALSVAEINVKIRLWDVLMNVFHRKKNGGAVQMGIVATDSLSTHPLAGYRLDLSITQPRLILAGDWSAQFKKWTHPRPSPTPSSQLDTLISLSGIPLGQRNNPSAASHTSNRLLDLGLISELEVSDGKIFLDPGNRGELILLADDVHGGIQPVKQATRGHKSQASLRGKLFNLERENLGIDALFDIDDGAIDSLRVELMRVSLKQLATLWQKQRFDSSQQAAPVSATGDIDSTGESPAKRQPFYKDLQIDGGFVNGYVLLQPRDRANGAQTEMLSAGPWISQFQLGGELELHDGQMRFGDRLPVVADIYFKAEIREGKLDIKYGEQRVNEQPVKLSGTIGLQNLLRPDLDLTVESDSLMLADFLAPFIRRNTNGVSPQAQNKKGARFPIRGQAKFHGRIVGPLLEPQLTAALYSPHLEIHDQSFQHIAARLTYTPQHSDGTPDSTLYLVECTGAYDGLQWKGSGAWNFLQRQRPWQINLSAGGELTPSLKKLLPFEPPLCNAEIEARVSGPLKNPKASGEFLLRVLNDRQRAAAPCFAGQFTFNRDTLRIETSNRSGSGTLAENRMLSECRNITEADSASSPVIEMSGEVWNLFGLPAGKSAPSLRVAKSPSLRFYGTQVQLLPAIFGKNLPATFFSDLTFDTYLQGNADSMNIRIDGRNKEFGYTQLQLFGYMWTMRENKRHISGSCKFFPGAYNEMNIFYSAVWQDSVFYVTDLRAGEWLTGGLEVEMRGNRSVRGDIKITRADISRILESVARERPQYQGNGFAELHLGGTLDNPRAEGDFWILDGVFNGVGNFSISGKARFDTRGWESRDLNVQKNNQPFLEGAFSYDRSTHEPRLELRASDIEMSDLLGAAAGIPSHIFTGRASFALKTTEAIRLPDGDTQCPLTGFIKIQNGRIKWFAFDEITMNLDADAKAEGTQQQAGSYLHRDGIFFGQARYKKKNEFTLNGSAYLPFNLRDDVHLSLKGEEGNFLSVLPDFTSFFQQTASKGKLDLNIVGPYQNLTLRNSHLNFENGFLKMTRVVPEAHGISGEAFVDSRGDFIHIINLKGKIGDATLSVWNMASPPALDSAASAKSETNGTTRIYHPLRLGSSRLQLGTLLIKSSENGVLATIPGLMERGETGRFIVAGQDKSEAFQITGPWANPVFRGRVVLENVAFMFPFDENAEPADSLIRKILLNTNWDVVAQSRKDNRYVKRIPTAIDNVYVNFGIDDGSELQFRGIFQDSTFWIEGSASSTRGTVEYLDLNFRVEKFGAEFDKSDLLPIVYGRAYTVLSDSSGFPHNVYLTLHTKDPVALAEVERGRFQNAYFKLSSDIPNLLGDTQEQVLATLGYSADNVRAKATEAVGISTDNLIFRPLIRPVERQLKRHLGLDIVHLSSRFTRNLLVANFGNNPAPNLANEAVKDNRALAMLQDTRLLLGKYLWSDFYFHYIGQIAVGPEQYSASNLETPLLVGLSLRHTLGLEYRINPAMLLQFEYDYNPSQTYDKYDRKIWLRHSFPVDFSTKEE